MRSLLLFAALAGNALVATAQATVDVLEMKHPDYAGPIQGTVSGDSFPYVANSQLGPGNAETGAFAADRARPTVVLALHL